MLNTQVNLRLVWVLITLGTAAGCHQFDRRSAVQTPVASLDEQQIGEVIVKFYRQPTTRIPLHRSGRSLRQTIARARDLASLSSESLRYIANDNEFLKAWGLEKLDNEYQLFGDDIRADQEVLVLIRGNERFFVPSTVASNTSFGRMHLRNGDVLLSIPAEVLTTVPNNNDRIGHAVWETTGRFISPGVRVVNVASGFEKELELVNGKLQTLARALKETDEFDQVPKLDAMFIVRRTGPYVDQIVQASSALRVVSGFQTGQTIASSPNSFLLDGDVVLFSRFEQHPQVLVSR